eukprot:scaffold5783_cov202-Prasinococcus_capsulatus_cf.AAC.1
MRGGGARARRIMTRPPLASCPWRRLSPAPAASDAALATSEAAAGVPRRRGRARADVLLVHTARAPPGMLGRGPARATGGERGGTADAIGDGPSGAACAARRGQLTAPAWPRAGAACRVREAEAEEAARATRAARPIAPT